MRCYLGPVYPIVSPMFTSISSSTVTTDWAAFLAVGVFVGFPPTSVVYRQYLPFRLSSIELLEGLIKRFENTPLWNIRSIYKSQDHLKYKWIRTWCKEYNSPCKIFSLNAFWNATIGIATHFPLAVVLSFGNKTYAVSVPFPPSFSAASVTVSDDLSQGIFSGQVWTRNDQLVLELPRILSVSTVNCFSCKGVKFTLTY